MFFSAVQPECTDYKLLSEENRNENYSSGVILCDSSMSTGWYRFRGGAGDQISTTCHKGGFRCGTQASGWMQGSHPTTGEGIVKRRVCFALLNVCCYREITDIEVLNCGPYFIYKLRRPNGCNLRYCGS